MLSGSLSSTNDGAASPSAKQEISLRIQVDKQDFSFLKFLEKKIGSDLGIPCFARTPKVYFKDGRELLNRCVRR